MLKMTMKDIFGLRAKAHRGNLVRYCRLLGTPLTEFERAYMNRRIAEERTELQRLERPFLSVNAKHAVSRAG